MSENNGLPTSDNVQRVRMWLAGRGLYLSSREISEDAINDLLSSLTLPDLGEGVTVEELRKGIKGRGNVDRRGCYAKVYWTGEVDICDGGHELLFRGNAAKALHFLKTDGVKPPVDVRVGDLWDGLPDRVGEWYVVSIDSDGIVATHGATTHSFNISDFAHARLLRRRGGGA